MNLLHLNTEYSNRSLHRNMVQNLLGKVEHQYVYVPLKKHRNIGKNRLYDSRVSFFYSDILSSSLRILYFRKIKKIYNDAIKKIDFRNIDLIHSHTLFSSGGAAYLLNKKYGVPYVITIRKTDFKLFFKYFIHLRPFSYKILLNSSKIILLSPKYLEILRRKVPTRYLELFNRKAISVPNGIDDFWLSNLNKNRKIISGTLKLLYVGELNKNKNVETVIKLTKYLNRRKLPTSLVIVGEGVKKNRIIKEESKNAFISFYPKIENKSTLLNLYRVSDIFVMPSYWETFGLVYGEAMSQGVPVIYSKGQGIDGYFEEGEVGYSVNPRDVKDMADKIQLILDNYSTISKNCIKNVQQFKWETIAKTYADIYKECIK